MTTVADSGSLSLMEALQDSEIQILGSCSSSAITMTMPTIVLIGPTNYHTLSS